MKVYACSHTTAGIARLAQQRGLPPAIIETPKPERALVAAPVADNVVRFRKRPSINEPMRMPSAQAFSREKHLAFLRSLDIATHTPVRVLIERVAAWHDLAYSDMISKSRRRNIVVARDEAIAAVKAMKPKSGDRLSYSLPMLGRIFGGRDHTTILSALRRHAKRGLA